MQIATDKANKIVGILRRSFTCLDQNVVITLYKSLIRPLLEYGNIIIYPRYERDRKLIEAVQHRATKLIPKVKTLSYEDRLRALKLPSMYYRRERGDMIECYKYTHNHYNSDPPFKMNVNSGTRGHSLKIVKDRANKSIRQHFFSYRVVDKWNSLPDNVVHAPTVDNFKSQLDRHW